MLAVVVTTSSGAAGAVVPMPRPDPLTRSISTPPLLTETESEDALKSPVVDPNELTGFGLVLDVPSVWETAEDGADIKIAKARISRARMMSP